MNKKKILIGLSLITTSLFPQKYADMSDPMAIYTNVGGSYGSNGVNLKLMKEVESKNENEIAAIIAEVKNGYNGNSDTFTDFRLRHFSVDSSTGIGTNIDFNYNSSIDGGRLWVK